MKEKSSGRALTDVLNISLRLQPDSADSWGELLLSVSRVFGASSAVLFRSSEVGDVVPVPELLIGTCPTLDQSPQLRAVLARPEAREFADWLRRAGAMAVVSDQDAKRELNKRLCAHIERVGEIAGFAHFAIVKIWRSPSLRVFLALFFDSAHGVVRERELSDFAAVAQRCREAMLVTESLVRESAAHLAASFDGLSVCAFVLNAHAVVLGINDRAKQALLTDGIGRLESGSLELGSETDNRALHFALQEASKVGIADVEISPFGLLGATRLIALRIGSASTVFGIADRFLILLRAKNGALVAPVSSSCKGDALTRAEHEVAMQLAYGRRIADIARLRHVSIETVRSQVKAIYSKMNVRNQVELMRAFLLAA